MEEIELDQDFNGNHYQIIRRQAPPPNLLISPNTPIPTTLHYLLNGVELTEREWDKQLMMDKQAETGPDVQN